MLKMDTIIIEIDAYKKKIPGYDPNKPDVWHRESAKLADLDFRKALKNPRYKRVILMCGGSASGKSEFVSSNLKGKKAIVYDGTLSSIEGVKVKIRNIRMQRLPSSWVK